LPSAGLGALLALLVFKTELTVIAFIGIILLIGIVKKNGIMMVDFALAAERQRGIPPAQAIREACREIGSIFLDGSIVATTCEPCPMCMSALHWARVETVYYGATIADAADAGFNELQLPAAELLRLGGSTLKLVPHVLPAESRALFAEWKNNPKRVAY